jgi:hypothetical protein
LAKYIAIRDVGGFKAGSEIPEESALLWNQMYKHPHAKIVESEKKPEQIEVKKVEVAKTVEQPFAPKPVKSSFGKR